MDDSARVVQDGSGAVKLSFISHISALRLHYYSTSAFWDGWYIIALKEYYKGTVNNWLNMKYDLPIVVLNGEWLVISAPASHLKAI